jgi:hypothetical protein
MVDLAPLLRAEHLGSTTAVLPRSGRSVDVPTFLRTEVRGAQPIPHHSSCWAPNKPTIIVDGRETWAEFAILRALEKDGWAGCWIKNWAGGREFCSDVGRRADVPRPILRRFAAIHARVPELRGAGTWDVMAWGDDALLFIESKKHRSGDRLRPTQLSFLEAALDEGVSPESFAIVEYELVQA